MGRKSKLSDAQWLEIERRLLDGEAIRALAREFEVSDAAIRQRGIPSRAQKTKDVANQIVATERALSELPISSQINAQNYAARLRSMSDHVLNAAHYGAATSHRLAGIAHAKVQEIDDAAPLDEKSRDALRDVAALTKLANDASAIPLSLMAANKKAVERIGDEPPAPLVPVDRSVYEATARRIAQEV